MPCRGLPLRQMRLIFRQHGAHLLKQGERAAMQLPVGDEAPFGRPVMLVDPETR